MVTTVDGTECEYELRRSARADAPTVLFLHGWGGGLSSFAGAFRVAAAWDVTCVNFAFPKRVPDGWGIYEYAACVRDFMAELDIDRPIIVGHSFGGRVAVILAAQGLCGKLVLVDGAGLKPRRGIKKRIAAARYRYRAKHGKSLDGFGSTDYNNAEREMRPVFVRIVNTHLDRLLGYIECETLLFWGRNDRDTPPYMAKRFARGIKNSRLVFVDGGHFSYIDCEFAFLHELKSFVTE